MGYIAINSEGNDGDSNGIETFAHLSLIFMVASHLLYFIYMLIKQHFLRELRPINNIPKPKHLRKINSDCLICLDQISNEVQLVCSHSFCAGCIMEYGKQRCDLIKCPICREESKLLFTGFDRKEDNKDIYDQIVSHNHEVMFHSSTSLCLSIDLIRFSLYYLEHVRNTNDSLNNKLMIGTVAVFMAVSLYPLSFVDFLGLLKDFGVYIIFFIFVGKYFYQITKEISNYELFNINTNGEEEESHSPNHSHGHNQSTIQSVNSNTNANKTNVTNNMHN